MSDYNPRVRVRSIREWLVMDEDDDLVAVKVSAHHPVGRVSTDYVLVWASELTPMVKVAVASAQRAARSWLDAQAEPRTTIDLGPVNESLTFRAKIVDGHLVVKLGER